MRQILTMDDVCAFNFRLHPTTGRWIGFSMSYGIVAGVQDSEDDRLSEMTVLEPSEEEVSWYCQKIPTSEWEITDGRPSGDEW